MTEKSGSTRSIGAAVVVLGVLAGPALAADWPMWRYDAGRTAASPEVLPADMAVQWIRQLPSPKAAWPWNQDRLQFDVSYEPIAVGDTLFVPSMVRDSVTAYDAATGTEKWRFYADGPVRFAPAAAGGKLYFTSDDGCLYCLDAATGALHFRFQAAPIGRRVLGNDRMISTWPARGAPVVVDGVVYFAAGIWPFMGTLIYGLDAETGKVVWENSGSGAMYLLQPHDSPAFANVAPQGYLAAVGGALLIPGGRAVPAAYERATGAFRYYRASNSAKEGDYALAARDEWFVNAGGIFRLSDGEPLTDCDATVLDAGAMYSVGKEGLVIAQALRTPDEKVVTKTDSRGNETKTTEYTFPELWRFETGLPLTRLHLKAGPRLYVSGKDGLVAAIDTSPPRLAWQARVEGEPWSMIAANGRLFLVTKEGRLYCLGQAPAAASPPLLTDALAPAPPTDCWTAAAAVLLKETGITEGYALVPDIGTGRLAEELARQSELHVVALAPDAAAVQAARKRLDDVGLYGQRVAVLEAKPETAGLPPYFASLVACEGVDLAPGRLPAIFHRLRPYGGTACFSAADAAQLGVSEFPRHQPGAALRTAGEWTLLVREGPLPGAGSWTQQYGDSANTVMSADTLVKAPLGLLWFGGPPNLDVLPRHGHGPAPEVIGGRLFIEGIGVLSARDVYTGRLLWTRKFEDLDTFGAYYNETYVPDPFDRSYNQKHIPGANEVGSNFAVTEDRVYVTAGPKCHVLDPATGDTLTDFALTVHGEKEPLNWGYLGVYEDLLIATGAPVKLAGEDVTRNTRFAAESQYLLVMDRHSGVALWTRRAAYAFRHNAIVAGRGKVFCIDGLTEAKLDLLRRRGEEPAERPRLLALDARTGALVWTTEADVFGTWLGYSTEHDILLQGGSKSSDRPSDEAASGMAAYRGADGSVLWQTQETYLGPPILHHDRIITQVAYGTRKATPAKVYNLLTGQEAKRTHPLTGDEIPQTWVRFYGCNTAIASENLLTFRSAAASFANLATGEGTCSIGGFKSGCTSNLIAADGVLSAPDYTRTCTCSYQNQSSLALVHDPETEMWFFDCYPPPAQPTPVKRLGLNLGAPGNRMAEDGTLFIEVPSVGGPSPDIPVRWSGDAPRWFRHHSALFHGAMPWVGASGLEGAGKLTIRPFLQPPDEPADAAEAYVRNAFTTALDWPATMEGAFPTPRTYTVRLYFAEPENRRPGERVFSVALQGKAVLTDFDVAAASGPRTTVVEAFPKVQVTDDLVIALAPAPGSHAAPLLCGVELLAEPR